jgi:hypothetical protein
MQAHATPAGGAATAATLRRAAAVVRVGWRPGACARDAAGAIVSPHDPAAVVFDAEGALAAVAATPEAVLVARDAVCRLLGIEPALGLLFWEARRAGEAEEIARAFERAADGDEARDGR